MKSEQQKIAKQLATIDNEVKAHECAFSAITERLKEALDLMEDCGSFYRLAEDHIKKLLNQAIFSKLWVEKDGRVTAEFAEPFRTLVDPIKNEVALYNKEKARGTEVLTDIFSVIASRVSHFFGYGLNNDFLADDTRLELVTSRTSTPEGNFFASFIVLFSRFHSISVALWCCLTTMFPGVPGVSVVSYVVKREKGLAVKWHSHSDFRSTNRENFTTP